MNPELITKLAVLMDFNYMKMIQIDSCCEELYFFPVIIQTNPITDANLLKLMQQWQRWSIDQ